MNARFISIDEEGYLASSGLRLNDNDFGREVLQNIRVENRAFITTYLGEKYIVEAFDSPYVALSISIAGPISTGRKQLWTAQLPYETIVTFNPMDVTVDDWDRFLFRTPEGVPMTLGRNAQMQFFDAVDDFDDDSITIAGQKIHIPAENTAQDPVQSEKFWSEKYTHWKSTGEKPGWDLDGPAKPLTEVLPQIKIPRSRVAILGSGMGHDANYFANQGHLTTGFDFSMEALAGARTRYPASSHLQFEHANLLELGREWHGRFDVVFEHTFFCAIDPAQRTAAVQTYSKLLQPGGFLLGIFFVMDKTGGPPFGATEWELRERLKKNFEFLYWTRWHTSTPDRLGKELVIYAKKR